MHTLEPQALLRVWESGVHASPTMRGLLLMGAALPQADLDGLMSSSIGHRDAWLLSLREALFGARIECLLPCPACGQRIELDFCVSDIRAPHAEPQHLCEVVADGSALRFRVPTSADLLAIEGERNGQTAERMLLQRLWTATAEVPHAELSPALMVEVADALAHALGEADRQAEVLLELACPACGQQSEQMFDIASHLWCELDHWARGLLQKVHALACRYGWSEDCILGMSTARRQAYLALIGAV